MDSTLEAALRAVGEAPEDEGRRLVLTDLLLEQGDPRGEFVTLQRLVAANQAHAAVHGRISELLGQHGREWFKELEPFVVPRSVELRSGFPIAARLREELRPEQLEQAFACPMFVTLEELHGRPQHVLAAVASPRMRALRRLSVARPSDLAHVLDQAQPNRLTDLRLGFALEEPLLDRALASPVLLRVRTVHTGARKPTAARLVRELDRLPVLEELRLSSDSLHPTWLPTTWPGLRLRRLVLSSNEGTVDLERKATGTEVLFHGFAPKKLVGLRHYVPEGTTHVGLLCAHVRSAGVDPDEVLAAFEGLDPRLSC